MFYPHESCSTVVFLKCEKVPLYIIIALIYCIGMNHIIIDTVPVDVFSSFYKV